MHVLNGIEITASKDEVLRVLKKNCKTHIEVVTEARKGYIKKAKEVLEKRLKQLEEGKLVELRFQLTPPQDYTKVYETAIAMLELEVGQEVVLNSEQVRNLYMDEWDWSQHFWGLNKMYSTTANAIAERRGY